MRLLNYEQENRSVLHKLLYWCRYVRHVKLLRLKHNHPGFSKFVNVESDIANDPIACDSSSSSSPSSLSSSNSKVSHAKSIKDKITHECHLCRRRSYSPKRCDRFIICRMMIGTHSLK